MRRRRHHDSTFLAQSSNGDQEQVEAAAEEEIGEIVRLKEGVEQRKAELAARQRLAEKEREDMGVMWGMGESLRKT